MASMIIARPSQISRRPSHVKALAMRQRILAASSRRARSCAPRDSSSADASVCCTARTPTSSVSATTEAATAARRGRRWTSRRWPRRSPGRVVPTPRPEAGFPPPPHRRHSPHNCTAHVPLPPFAAEEALTAAKLQPQFCILLLQLIGQDAELPVRQAAAVYFKNLTRQHWEPADEGAPSIDASVKGQVKDGLLSSSSSSPSCCRRSWARGWR